MLCDYAPWSPFLPLREMSTGSSEFHSSGAIGRSIPSSAEELVPRCESSQEALLNLRIVRGPLKPHENQSILSQYNSLASANVPTREFLRWIQDSPEGPAWHAILEANDGDIVGHTSLFPFRATHDRRSMVAAKSEYSFIREEFRASKIRGFEQTGRLKNLIYIDELFRRCRAEGWSPLLISTSSAFHRVFRSIACFPVNFPLWECLLVLRPYEAGWRTPNLRRWQRVSLCGAGLAQTALWTPTSFFAGRSEGLRVIPLDEGPLQQPCGAVSFFEDQNSLAWRYPEGQYERIMVDDGGSGDFIVKYGSASRYLRVCQWELHSGPPNYALVARLVQMARQQKALGVRWAVYGENASSEALVRRLRNLGFLCVRRVRTLLVNTVDQQFLNASAWNLTDSMFSFDL
jgi:hypothetical protein